MNMTHPNKIHINGVSHHMATSHFIPNIPQHWMLSEMAGHLNLDMKTFIKFVLKYLVEKCVNHYCNNFKGNQEVVLL